MNITRKYYFTSPDGSLFLAPNGDTGGYIISDKRIGMAIWYNREKAMSIGHLLGIIYDGWTLREEDTRETNPTL